MDVSNIKSRKQLQRKIKRELYDWTFGFPIRKCGALSSSGAETLLLNIWDRANELANNNKKIKRGLK